MKAILEFDLPEEREEFDTMLKATKMHNSIYDTFQLIRKMDKYESFDNIEHVWHDDKCFISLEDFRSAFIAILEDNDTLDMI